MPDPSKEDKNTLADKYAILKGIYTQLGKVVTAYSGGADSSLLVYTANLALGKDNVLAVTADSETYTREELAFAKSFTANYGITHRVITTCELETINAHGNAPNRCYYCKHELFSVLKTIAAEGGFTVCEGSNLDDQQDYRPGSKARDELGIRSPLKEAGFTKNDIRMLSKELGLPTWDKPAYACLTSRFPYNVPITKPELAMVERAEEYLHKKGFIQCRVRHYGTKARIEVEGATLAHALSMQAEITTELKAIGYAEVEIDPSGYRMGSMNVFKGSH